MLKFAFPATTFLAVLSLYFIMENYPSLPNRITYVPDAIIACVTGVVLLRLLITRRLVLVPLRYWLLFIGFVYVVVSGSILNAVRPDVTFAGVRFYFKYVPLFLLPFAFDYSDKDIKRLLTLLAGIALLQVPIAFRQRFFVFTDSKTLGSGDVITGSLGGSGNLSLFLVGAIIMLTALYLDKHVSLKTAIVMAIVLILPATINETKVTPIALGVGALAVLFARRKSLNLRQLALVAVSGGLLLTLFVVVYDRMYMSKIPGSSGFVDFMSHPQSVLDRYSYKGMQANTSSLERENDVVGIPYKLVDQNTWIGRFDSLAMPFQVLPARDGTQLMLGLGIGNVSSTFGSGGRYVYLKDQLGASMTTISQLIWETGVLGALLGIVLVTVFVKDALALSARQTEWRTLGAGWFGVSAIVLSTLAYSNFIEIPQISCLVAFFSGVVASKLRVASDVVAPTMQAHAVVPERDRRSRAPALR
jgi:hypothetical protein